jgi:hypothetical protein
MSDQREQFQKRVETLVAQVESWAEPHEWVTKRYPKKMREESGLVYEAPALFLQKGPTRLLLDPVAYDVPGADGVVDLYLMPTYDDMANLYFANGAWTIHYFPSDPESGHVIKTDPLPLSEQAIIQTLDSIAAHAEPSF